MQRWAGRVAVVTGASAGIGAAIAQELVDHGMIVVALARRVDKIEEAVAQARKQAVKRGSRHQIIGPGKLHLRQCDVSKEQDILTTFQWVKEILGGVDVLVNNAGVSGQTPLTETNTDDWQSLLDINVLGLSICTREAIKSMRERGVDDGHVIHIGSVVCHIVTDFPAYSFYCATKHAVFALTEGLRKDLAASKSKIRVSCVSPGAVRTEFGSSSMSSSAAEQFYSQNPYLEGGDIADAVLYVLGAPPHVQIHEIIVKPVGEMF